MSKPAPNFSAPKSSFQNFKSKSATLFTALLAGTLEFCNS